MYVCVCEREIIEDKSFENIFIATYIYPRRKQLNSSSFLKLILEQKREVKTWAEQKIKPTSSFPFTLLL
jgi:hypothetical protein